MQRQMVRVLFGVAVVLGARMFSPTRAGEETPVAPAPAVKSLGEAAEGETLDPAAAETVLLRYRFSPGQIIRYVTYDDSTVEVEQSGEATTVRYSTRTWKHYRVKSVDASGTAVVEVVIDRVHMRAAGEGQTIEFDSREPGAAPPQFAHILDTIGRAVVALTVHPSGRMEGAEFLLGRETQPLAVQDRDAQILALLPPEPVRVGETWRERFDVPVKIDGKLTRNVRLQRTYRLTALQKGRATIDLETIILTPPHDPELESQLIQRTPSGVLELDVEHGLVLSKRTLLHNQVVGFSGPGSRLKVIRSYQEHLDAESHPFTAQSASDPSTPR
jgi:hypothetical protein